MRIIVVGLGVQGQKRKLVAGSDVVATVDPHLDGVDYKSIYDVPLQNYDAALLCIPDEPKLEIIKYLLSNNKHLLVEKPLFSEDEHELEAIEKLASEKNVTCYTAYNHRFEPHFIRMKDIISTGKLGKIYALRMFYGNGTARLVRDSMWRDRDAGVLPDLGSHLLDTARFWLGDITDAFEIQASHCHENRAPDHVCFGNRTKPSIQLECTLLSWRNHFYADIFAENGSAHISSLCKWGPSIFTHRERKLPSGRPNEISTTLVESDPTWGLEYEYFKKLCRSGEGNLSNDIWINRVLSKLSREVQI